MAAKIVFRGQQTTTTASGTDLTLIDAVTGYENFNPTCEIGDSFYGVLELQDKQWEAGLFTIVSLSPTVVSRPTTPIASSTTFTMTAGTHTLKCCDMQGSAFGNATDSDRFDFNAAILKNVTLSHSLLAHGGSLNSAFQDTNIINNHIGNFVSVLLTANRTITLNATAPTSISALGGSFGAGYMVFEVEQDAIGGWTIDIPYSAYNIAYQDTYGNPNIDLTPSSVSLIVVVNGRYMVIKKNHLNVNLVYDVDMDITLSLRDANSTYHRTSADTTARTWTIPANSSVPFMIGTKQRLLNMGASGNISVPITTDTLNWLPTGGTGTRTIAPNGYLDLEKITATMWICSGVGVT